MTYSAALPEVESGSVVVGNASGAEFDAANIGGSGINGNGGLNNGPANDTFTYVANNQPVQGQTFRTGTAANGYKLNSITVRMAGYTNNIASGTNNVSWNLLEQNGPILLSISRIDGTNRTLKSVQLFKAGELENPGSGNSANGPGKYITFHLPFTTALEANTTYGFELQIGNGGANYFEWHGISNSNAYPEGTAYHHAGAGIASLAGDRVFVAAMTPLEAPPTAFSHPGTLHTQADLNRMKAKIDAKAEPWLSGYNVLLSSPYNNLGWPAYNVDYIVRGGSTGNNYTRSQQDAQLIYTLALIWHLTGDTAYANRAVHIANTWSDLIGIQGDSNSSLAAGICGYLFAVAGDLLSTYPGWPTAEKQAYKDMMMRVFYPANLDFLWRQHDTFWRTGGNTHYRLNWPTANMASMAAIGILCDNRAVYEQAVDFFKYGPNNGRVERAAWYLHPGGLGQGEEAGRDQGHNLGGWHAMALLCQMAWNQGDDLFAYDNNRVLRAFEYNAKYNLGNDVPYARHRNSDIAYTEGTVSSAGRGLGYPQYELVYNHYVNTRGIAAPWSQLAAQAMRPEPWPNTGLHPSQVDWFGLGTLTYSKDPATSNQAPAGLRAHWSKNRVVLDWWGSARATNYVVNRANAPEGPYTQLGSVTGTDLAFTDTNVSNSATHFYVISAGMPSGSLTSAPLKVARELVTHYTFEGNAKDLTGTRDATLRGGSTGLPAFGSGSAGSQAIDLDGADDYIQLPAGSANHQDITLAAWVRWDGGAKWQRVFDFGSEIEKTMYLTVANGSGLIEFGFTTTRGGNFIGDASYYLKGPAMPINVWTHLAVTINGDIATLYVNGVPRNTQVVDLIDPLFGQIFCYLGKSIWNGDPLFNGAIDDFRIYNHALSGNEVYGLWGLSANKAPAFGSDPMDLTVSEDVSLAQALQAGDADGGILVYSKLSGPAWLTVNANGSLVGTPSNSEVGENYFVVRVADPSGATDDAVLRINVLNINDAPVWASSTVAGGAVALGDAYSLSVAGYPRDVDDGDMLAFTKMSGPAWATVSTNGQVTGTPGALDFGTNSFIIRATDGNSAWSEATLVVEVQPRSLRSHYAFEGNLQDSEGALHGTSIVPVTYGAGKIAQAALFNGTNSTVVLPAGVASYQNITLATWVFWNGGASWQRLFDFGSDPTHSFYLTPFTGAGMRFVLNNGITEQSLTGPSLASNQWVHIAVTLSGDTGRLYVNGLLMAVNEGTTTSPLDIPQTFNYLGKSQSPADPLFNGLLDEFRIYNYALSPGDIAALAGVSLPAEKTVAHWNFEEGTANTYVPYAPASAGQNDGSMKDISGNANHLSAWAANWEWYRDVVPGPATPQTGVTNRLSVQNANGYNAMSAIGTSLTSWNPLQWTIEAAFRTDRTTGFQTLVGRDSYGAYAANPAQAALYFSIRPGGVMAISFTDSAGNNWNLESPAGVVKANQWQAVAATSDGGTLALFIKNITAGETQYTRVGTLNIAASANARLSTGAGDGSDWDAGVITVGRGLFNGGHTDRFYGYLDDVRLSNAPLKTNEFLYSRPPIPSVPTGLSAQGSNEQVTLTWNVVANATSYKVKRSAVSGGPYVVIANASSSTFTDAGLVNGMPYFYVVSASGVSGESSDSAQVTGYPVSTSVPDLVSTSTSTEIRLEWPETHTGWRLQSQTNSAGTGLSDHWTDVPGSRDLNQITLPVGTTNGSVFFRLIYP